MKQENMFFNLLEVDTLRELSNIGAGNAATSLSVFLGCRIDINVPLINTIKLSDICSLNKGRDVYGIIVKVTGEILGNILIVFEKRLAESTIEKLTGEMGEELTEVGISVLSELGNVISTGYMNSIAETVGIKINSSVPGVFYNKLNILLKSAILEIRQEKEYILLIKTIFKRDEKGEVGVDFYYIPMLESLEKIFKKIIIN
ncbi:MAG: chemotaxis protein CheC [Clostridium sp.]|uniref:chemotaxis protein CheC n=1 Tax=Clostridium sp. TaxID=1506 RepID=UPI003EE50A67